MTKARYRKWTCSRCPCWVNAWCGVFAKWVKGAMAACEYGRKRIWNEYQRKYKADRKA